MAIDETASKDQTDTPVLSRYLTANAQLFAFLSKTSTSDKTENGEQIPSSQKSLANASEGNLSKASLAETMVVPIAATDASSPVVQVPESQSTNDALLAQIQKIISDSGESGGASITVTGNNLKAQPDLNGLQTTIPEQAPLPLTITSNEFANNDIDTSGILLPTGSEVPVEKANQDLTSMRHSIRQQYYEGKILPQTEQENQTSPENNQQNSTFSPNTKTAGESHTLSTMTAEQTNTFAQPLSMMQEGQKQPTVETLQPVILPSGTLVQQEEVIRQITEHLQISRRDNDTRINIKLHPAELGELKINLFVKEGAVRATVVASNQYAQEIIEKNVAKLRTILEGQGFTIGEISVTSKSDTAGNFNLFDRQLFSQNNYTPPSTKNFRTREALFTLGNGGAPEQETVIGVNVKI
ncbi:MAG: flagellar hook-length control protein FliK [Pseudomonadota bacterium]